FVLQQFLQLSFIFANCLRLRSIVHRDQVRIRESHHGSSGRLRKGAPVSEIRIYKLAIPVEIIVDRVILIAIILASEFETESRYAGEVLKCGMVRPVSKSLYQQVTPFAQVGTLLGILGFCDTDQMRTLKH